MNDLYREVETYIESMLLEKPEDIDGLLSRKGSCGSSLTVVSFAKMESQSAANYLYLFYQQAKEEKGELETQKRLAREYIYHIAERYRIIYNMGKTYTLLMRFCLEINNMLTFEMLAAHIGVLQRYLSMLDAWVGFCIPWNDLDQEFQSLCSMKHEQKDQVGMK